MHKQKATQRCCKSKCAYNPSTIANLTVQSARLSYIVLVGTGSSESSDSDPKSCKLSPPFWPPWGPPGLLSKWDPLLLPPLFELPAPPSYLGMPCNRSGLASTPTLLRWSCNYPKDLPWLISKPGIIAFLIACTEVFQKGKKDSQSNIDLSVCFRTVGTRCTIRVMNLTAETTECTGTGPHYLLIKFNITQL